MSQCRRCGFQNLEKEVYAIGEIRAEDKPRARSFNQRADALHLVVPAGGADHHRLAVADHRFDIRQNGVRRGEVDDDISRAKVLGGQPRRIFILSGGHGLYLIPALACDFGDKGTRLAAAEDNND